MPEDHVKIQKKSHSDDGLVCCSDGEYYPHGTSLRLQDEIVDDLKIESLAVGDIVEVRGYAFVDSKSEYSSVGNFEKSIGLQLTTIKIRREEGDRAEQMYGDN